MLNEPADTPDVLQYKFFSSVCQIYLNAESFVTPYANSTVLWRPAQTVQFCDALRKEYSFVTPCANITVLWRPTQTLQFCDALRKKSSFVTPCADSTVLPFVVWKLLLLVTNRSSDYLSGSNPNGDTLIQCVPLATETGISFLIVKTIKTLRCVSN
jgi:hypothetical protein